MSNLFFFLTGVAGLLLLIGLIKPAIFSKFMKEPTRKKIGIWFGSAAGFFFIIFVVFVAAESPTPDVTPEAPPVAQTTTEPEAIEEPEQTEETQVTEEEKPPEPTPAPKPTTIDRLWSALDNSMKTREHYDVAYNDSTKQVTVTYDGTDETVWDESAFVRDAYSLLVKYGLEAFGIDGVAMVRVVAKTGFVDQYGQTETKDGVRITMSKSEFEKFNWDELGYQSVYRSIENASDEYYIHPGMYKNLNFEKLYLSP